MSESAGLGIAFGLLSRSNSAAMGSITALARWLERTRSAIPFDKTRCTRGTSALDTFLARWRKTAQALASDALVDCSLGLRSRVLALRLSCCWGERARWRSGADCRDGNGIECSILMRATAREERRRRSALHSRFSLCYDGFWSLCCFDVASVLARRFSIHFTLFLPPLHRPSPTLSISSHPSPLYSRGDFRARAVSHRRRGAWAKARAFT